MMNSTRVLTEKWRAFDIIVTPIANAEMLVESRRSRRSSVLPPSEVDILLSCDKPETVAEHARRACRKRQLQWLNSTNALSGKLFRFLRRHGLAPDDLPLRRRQVAAHEEQVKGWIAQGFLVPQTELHEELMVSTQRWQATRHETAGRTRAAITFVGIPTSGRPVSLRACVESFLENFQQHRRTPAMLVLDDSRNREDERANQQVLHELARRFSVEIHVMNRRQRAAFGEAVAAKADVSKDLVAFALMGHAAYTRTEGGCRNACLLLSQGQLTLQTDDDTICRPCAAPGITDGIALSSNRSSDAYWFYPTFDEALSAVEALDRDFLGLHEEVVGRHVHEVLATFQNDGRTVNINHMRPSFARKMQSGTPRIRMSLAGPVGDTCLADDPYRLFLEGQSFERLIHPAAKYREKLVTRQVVRSVTELTISDFPRCIGMNFALDNSDILPPFMPVQTRCDGIFGDIMAVCFPEAFGASIPYVLAHRPPEDRSRGTSEPFGMTGRLRINDIIAAFIHEALALPSSYEPKDNLQMLGMFLRNLGAKSREEFECRGLETYGRRARRQMEVIASHLAAHNGPVYWRNDLYRLMTVVRRAVLDADFSAGVDVGDRSSAYEEPLKHVVRQLGDLLVRWPDIYNAMGRFEREEIDMYLTKLS